MTPLDAQRRLIRSLRLFIWDQRGVSALEFALIAPIFLLLFAGTIELGGMLYTRFQLNSALSAAASYTLLNGNKLSEATASDLVANTAAIVAGGTNSSVSVTVAVNKDYARTLSNGQLTTSGSPSDADRCYCPTGTGATPDWGTAIACESVCSNGSIAGKFITITAERAYDPLFSDYQIARDGVITVVSRAQVK
jgi:Flp pilus assembly protein TadG